MTDQISRRTALKWGAAGALVSVATTGETPSLNAADPAPSTDPWNRTHDRVWLGGDYWANPMEDWRIVDGAAECQSLEGSRSVHSLTHQITNGSGNLTMSVQISQVAVEGTDGGAGFRIGVQSELNEYRSNCFAHNGVNAGVRNQRLILGPKSVPIAETVEMQGVQLHLTGTGVGPQMQLTLEAKSKDGTSLGKLTHSVPGNAVLGNVALIDNYASVRRKRAKQQKDDAASRYRFSNWTLAGDAFQVSPQQRFGPLLWSMYTLSDSRSHEGYVLKLSALTGPLGMEDQQNVELQVQRNGKWESLGESRLDPDAWVATFRIANWDEKTVTAYRLVYRERHKDGTETSDEWTGTIQANPTGRPLRMATLTCQNDYAFPYEPVARNVLSMQPDLAIFSGDQIYENHGGFGIIRTPAAPAILNYLRKFYQFGWCFRELMRDCPTLCLPDDHDVFQGNLWGEGGAPLLNGETDPGASSNGGYAEPARMVNVVHRTNVAHHPDAYDPTPCLQNISVYYGELVYGGVGFAIVADRQWKSGPRHVDTGGGRPDHVPDPNFDTSTLDKPGLILLGERQEEFLKQWAQDWRGHTLKAVLSQTVFAGVATHHGKYDDYLKADLDCGSWPQTPRNRAVDLMRPSRALHINGDQHITTLCQYGTDEQRNANWSFCPPAIAVGYPRWWRPDEIGMPHANRPRHGLPDTGEYIDGFGNKVYVYAVGNPVVGQSPNRYEKAEEKGSGFGFVTFDLDKKTYFIESFRFLVDVTDGQPSNQYPGWPVTIHQEENGGKNQLS